MSKESSEVWINEIHWESKSNSLSIEVAGIYTGLNKFIITANGEDLWALDFDPSFDCNILILRLILIFQMILVIF